MNQYLRELYEYIRTYGIFPENSLNDFVNICMGLYNKRDNLDENEVECLDYVLKTCNLIYENTNYVLIEDDFYDQLVEVYRHYDPNFRIGAVNVNMNPQQNMIDFTVEQERVSNKPLIYNTLDKSNMIFYDRLNNAPKITREDCMEQNYELNEYITKRKVTSKQIYPELVGTLDKCKFVLNSQAIDKGVYNEDNVKIFERDFIGKHIIQGLINTEEQIDMTIELKYDGVSISAVIANGDTIISASTRGEVKEDLSADLTPIFKGYKFHHAKGISSEDFPIFGMKFEAIITKYNLHRYNEIRKTKYANGRTAIISILSSSEGYKYRDFITLIPLDASGLYDVTTTTRAEQIELLNRFYRNPEINKYTLIRGNYMSILFQVKKFVEEAEMMRDYINYMYDGIVVSYNDPRIRCYLGRENSVNKFSIAIKFTALKKQTKFLGYTYTVGQDGTITPMIHYQPVVFFGTVHDKASGHSYARFKQLQLRPNDIIDVEYTNDVMAYVTKPNNSYNEQNQYVNKLVEFPDKCPSCGSQLVVSPSGKNIRCENLDCPDRNIKRIDNMFKKLTIKDFSEAYLSQIGRYHLNELLNVTIDDVKFLGEVNSKKFVDTMYKLKTEPIYDYKIIGSLGFTNVSTEKWKLILSKYTLPEILQRRAEGDIYLRDMICNIKGIGPETANTIGNEMDFFMSDLITICNMTNVKSIKQDLKYLNVKKIRFTGCRNADLCKYLSDMGHDINGGGITKDTDILLIPYENYTSTKVNKAIKNGTMIVPIELFKANMNYYMSM